MTTDKNACRFGGCLEVFPTDGTITKQFVLHANMLLVFIHTHADIANFTVKCINTQTFSFPANIAVRTVLFLNVLSIIIHKWEMLCFSKNDKCHSNSFPIPYDNMHNLELLSVYKSELSKLPEFVNNAYTPYTPLCNDPRYEMKQRHDKDDMDRIVYIQNRTFLHLDRSVHNQKFLPFHSIEKSKNTFYMPCSLFF